MSKMSTPQPKPVVTYPAIVGRVLAQHREGRKIKQGDVANALGLSQSAYSRLESGDSVLNLSQLRNIAAYLRIPPNQVIEWADHYEAELRRQGVQVISEKQDNAAAIAVGLGLLAALLLNAK